ncbi:MAG: hypothetical protein EBS49_02720 [Verrucomicrobia bacterium]|nr:hypothetical protein [Verrucomicrobiota bacterium]
MRGYSFSAEKHLLQAFGGFFQGKRAGSSGSWAGKGRFRPRARPGFYRETNRKLTGKSTGNSKKQLKNRVKMPRKAFFVEVFGGFRKVLGKFLGFFLKKMPGAVLSLIF